MRNVNTWINDAMFIVFEVNGLCVGVIVFFIPTGLVSYLMQHVEYTAIA